MIAARLGNWSGRLVGPGGLSLPQHFLRDASLAEVPLTSDAKGKDIFPFLVVVEMNPDMGRIDRSLVTEAGVTLATNYSFSIAIRAPGVL